jgi:hypothetical protein
MYPRASDQNSSASNRIPMTIQETDPSTRLFHGVSLRQYASVQAGLGESFELDAVLAHEAIDPAAWPEAEDAWSDALLEGLEQENGVHEAFDEHLAAAQDRLGRRVPPIDEELPAWLDFVRRWAADPEPVALLDRLGIGPTDVVRLHRSWSRRLSLDPTLAQQALGILGRDPGELPVLRPEPRVLDRPEATATLHGEAVAPADVEAPRGDGTEPRIFVDLALWLSGEEVANGAKGITTGAPAFSGASLAPPNEGEETLPPTLSPFRRGPALPFEEARIQEMDGPTAIPATREPASPPPAQQAIARPKPDLGATVDFQSGLLAAALPFMKQTGPAPMPAKIEIAPALPHQTPAPSSPHGIARPSHDLGGTGVLPAGLLAAALPFMKQDGVAPPAQIPAAASPRGIARPSQDLGSTGVLPTGLLAAALPFMKSTTSPVAPPRDGRQPPLAPAVPTPAAEIRPIDARSGPPPPSPTVGPTPPRIDTTLTLAQYASLCAELAVFPAASEQIFQRYGLTAASQRISIDRAWKARLQSNAVEHKEWHQLYRHYQAVLTEQARRSGPKG